MVLSGGAFAFLFLCLHFFQCRAKRSAIFKGSQKTQGPDLTHAGAQRSGSDRDSAKTPQKHPFNLPADQW